MDWDVCDGYVFEGIWEVIPTLFVLFVFLFYFEKKFKKGEKIMVATLTDLTAAAKEQADAIAAHLAKDEKLATDLNAAINHLEELIANGSPAADYQPIIDQMKASTQALSAEDDKIDSLDAQVQIEATRPA